MMVHFPIALVFVTLGIDLAYWWTGAVFWVEAGLWSAGAAFAFGVAAALLGVKVPPSARAGANAPQPDLAEMLTSILTQVQQMTLQLQAQTPGVKRPGKEPKR